jgi:serine-type D-Ala-D-Ala carboxypeptidase/endopeptidase (penicillin-binding protein 4)
MLKFVLKFLMLAVAILTITACSTTKKAIVTTPLSHLTTDTNFNNAHFGVAVYKPSTNTYLLQHQSNKLFVPASNTKIVTCYTSFKSLGDSLVSIQYYETDSSIHVLGMGNPINMHQNYSYQPTIAFLKNQSKKIYLHNNFFEADGLGFGWSWDDYEATYMAERSFFPLYGNTISVVKDSSDYKFIPSFFKNTTTIENQNSKGFDITRKLATNNITVINGRNNNVKDITYSTQHPKTKEGLLFACNLLSEAIGKPVFAGQNFDKNLAKNLYNISTDSVLKEMMHESDNFFAEQLLLMSSYAKLGVLNDDKIIAHTLKTELAALPQKPKWVDGSGLSRYNLFSPDDFIFILNKIKEEVNWDRIKTIFATGNEGTLKGLYKNYQGNIFAKTGTLSNHVGLSGFLITKKGETLIFSVLVNNHTTTASNIRKSVEKMITQIIEEN